MIGFRSAKPFPCPPNLRELYDWPASVTYHGQHPPKKDQRICDIWESYCTKERLVEDEGACYFAEFQVEEQEKAMQE